MLTVLWVCLDRSRYTFVDDALALGERQSPGPGCYRVVVHSLDTTTGLKMGDQ